eukprot:TRINITY_DN4795_c0_g2_i2.p1 TRINITY_DN4795_c0_g2~~TRINITY_DN4795_c0_g2_i2.p1  ORF type:complete len:379 (+),score=44.15 TRINITY_DN4795_c0_g2_i2:41-1177(+)
MARLKILMVFLISMLEVRGGGDLRKRYPRHNFGIQRSLSATSRCTHKRSLLKIVVVRPSGGPCTNAVVSVQDDIGIKRFRSGDDGTVKTIVVGCDISVIVRGKGLQPTFKSVRLDDCKTGRENVVVKMNKRCNFKVYFAYNHAESSDVYGEGAHYQYEAVTDDSKYSTTTGAGLAFTYMDEPFCIYWEPNDADEDTSLKMEFKFSSAADPSLIHITRQGDGSAVVNVPPIIEDDYKFLICFNLWIDYDQTEIEYFTIYDDSGAVTVDNILEEDGNCVWLTDVLPYPTKTYLATVTFSYADSDYVDGNAYILDCHGKHVTVETPDETYHDYDEWGFLCFCPGAENVHGVKVLSASNMYIDSSEYPTSDLCSDACPSESK